MASKKSKPTKSPARAAKRDQNRAAHDAARAGARESMHQRELHVLQQMLPLVPPGMREFLRDHDGTYDEQTADLLLQMVCAGARLRSACDVLGLPYRWAQSWIARNDDGMRRKYDAACALRSEAWADDIVDIADSVIPDAGFVAAARLQIDVRKYLMAVHNRGRFGEKSTVTVEGDPNRPIRVIDEKMTPQEAMRLFEDTLRTYVPSGRALPAPAPQAEEAEVVDG